MFDFVDNTYSGVLSILSCLLGMSYPLIVGCIEKIDSRFHSTKLTERFLREISFKMFRRMLVVNLIVAVVAPFVMDGNSHCGVILGIQCFLVVLMVVSALLLFSRIIYTESTLKSKACLKCLYFTKIISALCCYLEYFSYLYTVN